MVRLEKWCCVLMFVSSLALAQAPQVMPFPLEVKRAPEGFTKEERETTQREFTRLLRLTGAQIPDFARFDFALKELKRQDCEREDACLAQLAKKAESLYAIYASLDFTLEGAVQVSGRVVRDDGKVVSPTQTLTLEGQPFKETATRALTQLLSQLGLAGLPAQRPVEAKAMAAVIAPPSVSKVDDPGAGQRTTGRAIFIAGAAAVAVSGAFLAAGQVMGGQLTPDAQLNLPLEQLPAFQSARTFTTAGLIGLAVGSVATVAGAFVWGLAPGGVKVSAMAGPQGAAISVQGAF